MERSIFFIVLSTYLIVCLTTSVKGATTEELSTCLNEEVNENDIGATTEELSTCLNEEVNENDIGKIHPDQFHLELFKKLATGSSPLNLIISPFSIWSVLVLGYYGSLGETQKQLSEVLGVKNKVTVFYGVEKLRSLLEDTPSEKATLHLNNKGYFSSNLKMKDCMTEVIPRLEKVDFTNSEGAAQKINSDVETATEGMIKEVVSSADLEQASLVLLNAVYFKGVWEEPFAASSTKKEDFFGADGTKIGQVDMMADNNRDGLIAEIPELNAELVELPYADSSVSMFLFHPKERGHGNIDQILQGLKLDLIKNAIDKQGKAAFQLHLPKFKLETRIDDGLLKVLQSLGITDLFDEKKANMGGFSANPMWVKHVIHKAVILVNEEGTEAAGASAMEASSRSAVLPPTLEIFFNHPFVYMVYDKDAKVILFAGTFREPKSVEEI